PASSLTRVDRAGPRPRPRPKLPLPSPHRACVVPPSVGLRLSPYLGRGRHGESRDPRRNRLVEAVIHAIVAARGQRSEGGDPGAHLMARAPPFGAPPPHRPG